MNRYMKYTLGQVFGTYIPNKYCFYYIIIIILTRVKSSSKSISCNKSTFHPIISLLCNLDKIIPLSPSRESIHFLCHRN